MFKKAQIDAKITEFGLQIGQSAEVLEQLGTPAQIFEYEDKCVYTWKIEPEDTYYSLDVKVENGVIIEIDVDIMSVR